MARANLKLIKSIRKTARKIQARTPYQWGHMGSCNCGHLAQQITGVSKSDIHSFALHSEGSWTDQSRAYCATSGLPMDLLISSMLDAGLELEDLEYLEKLSDPKVLKRINREKLWFNKREDVSLYMTAWAELLEEHLLTSIQLPAINEVPSVKNMAF